MELRQLECLVAVVEAGSFTAAAEGLGLSQPAVSTQVRRLERELGERLLERSGRTALRVTDAGRAVLAGARETLAAAEGVRTAVAGLSGLVTGRVRLGHVASGATASLAEPLARFHRRHPGVEVSLVEDSSDGLLEALRLGTLDLAWVGHAGDLPRGVEGVTVSDDPVVLAVAPDHELAGRRSVPLAAAVAGRLVALPRGTGSRAALDQACRAAGLELEVALECSAPDLVRVLVQETGTPAVLPDPLARALDLVPVPIGRPALRSRLSLAWARGGPSSAAARALLEVVGGS